MPTDLPDFDQCDDSGATTHVVEPTPQPAARPLSDWLADLARIFLDEPSTPAPATASR